MSKSYKPPGYYSVNPYLIVNDGHRFLDFLKQAFGAEVVEHHENSDGKLLHATCQIGDSLIGVGEGSDDGFPPMKNGLHMYVENTDEVYKQALEVGARSLYEPEDKEYGERSGGVEDPFGNQWYIATFLNNH